MIAQAKDPTLAMRCPSPLVLFGVDNRGKPKAARFGKQHAGLALKAATQLQLQVLAGNDPNIADLTAQLPVGRVHATGRTFVPFIRRDLYDKLLAAAANGTAHSTSVPPNGSSGGSGSTPGGSAPRLPLINCRINLLFCRCAQFERLCLFFHNFLPWLANQVER